MRKLIYTFCILMVLCLVSCSDAPQEEIIGEPLVITEIDINDINNYYIVLNGEEFVFGSKVQDILDSGFTTDEGDVIVLAEDSELASLFYDDEYVGLLSVYNDHDAERTVTECNYAGFATFSDALITGMQFSTVNGVTFGTSRQDIEAIFGIADNTYSEDEGYELIYYDDEENKGYSFWFVDDRVEEIQMFVY